MERVERVEDVLRLVVRVAKEVIGIPYEEPEKQELATALAAASAKELEEVRRWAEDLLRSAEDNRR